MRLFIQDQWTRGRMTLQGALRYDHAWSYYPAQQIGPTRFLPQGLYVPDTKGVLGYHDISPRMGVAYDLFGDGKTALKFHTGRYLEAAVNGNGNYSELRPINRISNSVTRTWTDANRNFEPDCDLQNGLAQDLRPTGGDFCGAWSNANFGKEVPVLSYDEQILKGWYNRPSDWQITATVQQEVVASRLGRGRLHASLAAELHGDRQPRGRAVGLHDVQRHRAERSASSRRWRLRRVGTLQRQPGQVQRRSINYRTYAPVYGNVSQVYNGVDVNVSARLRGGLQVQGGTSTGQQVIDSCERARQAAGTGLGRRVFAGRNPVQPDEPVLPRRARHHDARDGRRYLSSCRVPTCSSPSRSRAARACHSRPTGTCRARSQHFPSDVRSRGTHPTSR